MRTSLLTLLALACSPSTAPVDACFAGGRTDTDGDGLTDAEEIEIGIDPCKADTDGDGFDDFQEVVELSFDSAVAPHRYNPKIADLPSLAVDVTSFPVIEFTGSTVVSSSASRGVTTEQANSLKVSSVRTNAHSRGYERAIAHGVATSQGREQSTSESNSTTKGVSLSTTVGSEVTAGSSGVEGTASASVTATGSYEQTTETTSSSTTSFSTEQSYENTQSFSSESSYAVQQGAASGWTESLSEALQWSVEQADEIDGGRLLVSTRITNTSLVGYQLESVVLNAYEVNDFGDQRLPVASLAFEGVGQMEEGRSAELIFETDALSMAQTQRLLLDPMGLTFSVGGFDIETDAGEGFAQRFSQVRSNTATVFIDFDIPGGPEPMRFQVATETPDATGAVAGLTVAQLFEEVLYLDYETASEELRNPWTGEVVGTAERLVGIAGHSVNDATGRHWAVGLQSQEPLTQAADFSELVLRKGDVLHLVLVEDADGDGAGYLDEVRVGTNPLDIDTDNDGLSDGAEAVSVWEVWDGQQWRRVASSPTDADIDGDGLTDAVERERGLDPWRADTDGDGVTDDQEWGAFLSMHPGDGFTCGRGRSGHVRCWDGAAPFDDGLLLAELDVHESTACGLDDRARPDCWGTVPGAAPAGPLTGLAVGHAHACGISPLGEALCWGEDDQGQVSGAPDRIWTHLAAGDAHTCGIDETGAIVCWGRDDQGQVSDAPAGRFSTLALSDAGACAINFAGEITCWGEAAPDVFSGMPGARSAVALGARSRAAIVQGTAVFWTQDDAAYFHALDDVSGNASIAVGGERTCWWTDQGESWCGAWSAADLAVTATASHPPL
ncbi:MAG: hypothetical protein KTR31_19730 [Myxococcales bacterium]|nr:hypothetical protein [Myxococcales bacterium]